MADSYTEYKFEITPLNPGSEVLMAELAQVEFESFEETDFGLLAYIPTEDDSLNILDEIYILNSDEFKVSYSSKVIPQVNWNAKWEEEFKPIIIDDTCQIRASFHPKKNLAYDIVINPKMAFGTGHHATTFLMTKFLLEENVDNKTVLDMGCGTGVLAILSSKKGAKTIDVIDIDEWSYRNALENIELNNCENISVYEGDANFIKDNKEKYDVLFANINRNVLLEDLPIYADCIIEQDLLFLSGFYESDLPIIKDSCAKYNLSFQSQKTRDNWMAIKCKKTNSTKK